MSGSRPTDQPPANRRPGVVFAIVSLCFTLSGVAGLIYQMVWMRHLSAMFGTSEAAIVTVLVAYMGGLAAGSWVASRWLGLLKRPVLAYALLELAIALSAVLVPWLLKLAGSVHVALLGGQASPPGDGGLVEALALLAIGCAVLFVPTACMGATLPILTKGFVHSEKQIGGRVGWLYALNTTGAVVGTVLAAFYLIPALGLWGTAIVGVALNLLVAALGWSVARRAADPEPGSVTDEGEEQSSSQPAVETDGIHSIVVLAVMLFSGAIAFAYEVLWARLLAHVLGGSMYAFATMLAAFLGGIALGGLAGSRIARGGQRSACYWLAGLQVATGLLTALVFSIVGGRGFYSDPDATSFASQVALCVAILAPVTLCLGATFPLAVRAVTSDPASAGRSSGRVYAWNTLGAIIGAVGAGYFLIPAIGFEGSFRWAVCGNLLLAAVVLAAPRPLPQKWLAGAVALALATLVLFRPAPPLELLAQSPWAGGGDQDGAELIYHATGRSASVAVLRRRGSFLLRTNGLPEAEVFPRGADKLSYTRIRWLPALPKVLRPEIDSMLVVGLGGGALLESVPDGIKSVDVVELEAEVLRANEFLADKRAVDPLADPRIKVVTNDARGALRLTDKRYGAIVSQPSHPWTAGASHLYTREFLQLASEHLEPDGVFVGWLGVQFVDEFLFRSFAATVLEAFPHAQLYLVGDNFLFVASGSPLDGGFVAGARENGSIFHLSGYPKLSFVEDVLAALQLDEQGCRDLAYGVRPITDDQNPMATRQGAGSKLDGALGDPAALRDVLRPLYYLNQVPQWLAALSGAHPIDYRYLTLQLRSGAPAIDRQQYVAKVLPEVDKTLLDAQSALARQPEQTLSLVRTAVRRGGDSPLTDSLTALAQFAYDLRSWPGRKGGQPPSEFSDFVAANPELAASLTKLSAPQRAVLESRYWAATGQFARIREHEAALGSFADDHRSPWFEAAYQPRLDLLHRGSEADHAAAAELIDRLMALPLTNNTALVPRRIALAQSAGDNEYLAAMGWILLRKWSALPAGTPAGSSAMYRSLFVSMFAPYKGGVIPVELEELHDELVDSGALPQG